MLPARRALNRCVISSHPLPTLLTKLKFIVPAMAGGLFAMDRVCENCVTIASLSPYGSLTRSDRNTFLKSVPMIWAWTCGAVRTWRCLLGCGNAEYVNNHVGLELMTYRVVSKPSHAREWATCSVARLLTHLWAVTRSRLSLGMLHAVTQSKAPHNSTIAVTTTAP